MNIGRVSICYYMGMRESCGLNTFLGDYEHLTRIINTRLSKKEENCPQRLRKWLLVLTVHLSLVGKDNFATTAWWIYGECFLEALLDIRRPNALGVRRR
jgi:hypothetical protein